MHEEAHANAGLIEALQMIEDAPLRRLSPSDVAALPLEVVGVYPVDEREGWVVCVGHHPSVAPIYFAWAWARWKDVNDALVPELRHLPRTNVLIFEENGEVVPGSGQNLHWLRRLMSFDWQRAVREKLERPAS